MSRSRSSSTGRSTASTSRCRRASFIDPRRLTNRPRRLYIDRRYNDGRHMLTRNEFHVLLVLLRGSRHGYGVMRDVEMLTDGELRLGPGTLYTAIKRLVQAGLIEECEPDADRRRCYRVTRKGRSAAVA